MQNKKHSCLLLFVLLLQTINSLGQSGFNKFFPYSQAAIPSDVIVNKDSSFTVIAQFTNSLTGTYGLLLTRMDKAGTQVLQKNHFSTSSNGYYIFLKNKMWAPISERYFLILAACGNTNNTTGIIAAKIDALTLDTVWTAHYSIPLFDLPTMHIIRISANNFWLIGNKFDNNNPSFIQRPVAFKMDTMGTIVPRKEFTNLLRFGAGAVSYDSISSKLYFGGHNFNFSPTPKGYVACLDTSGTVLWNKEAGSYPAYILPSQISIKNNYLIVTGSKWISLIGSYDRFKLSLQKLNAATGNLMWQKIYGKEGVSNVLNSCTINPDESIVSCGAMENSYPGFGLNPDVITLKTNNNGDSLWLHSYSTYTGTIFETLYDIQKTLDGGYIMCGTPLFSQVPQTQNWVIKTDSLGIAPGRAVYPVITSTNVTVDIPPSNQLETSLLIYPNPASDYLKINVDVLTAHKITKIVLYNHLGQKLREEEPIWHQGQCVLKTNNLPEGIYFLKLWLAQPEGGLEKVTKRFVIGR